MTQPGRARILIVDDEALVLEGLQRHLQALFDLTLISNPKEALKLVVSQGPYAVAVSDSAHAGYGWCHLVVQHSSLAPDTVRVLLTGFGDLDAAITAVNEGNIFRFLQQALPEQDADPSA